MQDFRKLKVWEKSHILTKEIYEVTKCFPKHEMFSLTNQVRRSASSVPTNIAEGSNRSSDKEFIRFINIAIGSITETEYLILLSNELNYINEIERFHLIEMIVEVRKMLVSLKNNLLIKSRSS